jgi:hypothetical protein
VEWVVHSARHGGAADLLEEEDGDACEILQMSKAMVTKYSMPNDERKLRVCALDAKRVRKSTVKQRIGKA